MNARPILEKSPMESNIAKLPHAAHDFSIDPPPRLGRSRHASPIGEILIMAGRLTEVEVMRVLKAQTVDPLCFGELAIKLGLLGETDVRHALAQQFSYPYLSERDARVSGELFTAFRPFSKDVEQLRDLRSNLNLRWFRRNRRSLAMVIAAVGGAVMVVRKNRTPLAEIRAVQEQCETAGAQLVGSVFNRY